METIKENKVFKMLYRKGKKEVADSLVLYFLPSKTKKAVVGFTVSKKIGKAVVRNKIRRRLKELYRKYENCLKEDMILVFVARTACSECTFLKLEESFLKLLQSAGIIEYENSTDSIS